MKTLPITESERPTETKIKRKYVQPQIEKVRLVPEEAVLTRCKTGTYPFFIWNATICDAIDLRCFSEGS